MQNLQIHHPSSSPWNLYNIGSNNPIDLMDYISCIEKYLGKKAKIKMLPLQKGDVPETFADISPLKDDYEFTPKVSVDEGLIGLLIGIKSIIKYENR